MTDKRNVDSDNAGDERACGPTMPLALAEAGGEFELVRIAGGRRFQHRMAEMGLIPSTRFSIISKATSGPFILQVKEFRIVIGRGMIHRLHVRPI